MIKKLSKISVLSVFLLAIISISAFASNVNGEGGHDMIQRMTAVVFQLGVILFAAWIGGTVFRKFKMPGVLGEIIAGTIIGPYLLGGISLPGFAQGIFPLAGNFPITPELYAFTTVASIVLLFLVGLETDLDTFLQFSISGTIIGIGGVVVSFLLGNIAAVICFKILFGIQYTMMSPAPLFLGVISTATSVGISARILSEKRKMDSPEGVTILSGAVVDDVLGIILLAIVVGIIKSGSVQWLNVEKIAIKAIGIWLGFTVFGLVFATHIGNFLKRFKDKNSISVMALALALILAGIFEKSGLAMIIGAYIMGLSLSKTDLAFIIQENLSVVSRFLVPMFFCVMGMLVNIKEIMSPTILIFGLIFTIVAVVSKIIGCSLPALFLNFNLNGAMRIGIGMIPRGEVALIIAGIGLSLGVLEHDAFTIAIIMTFLTTLLTPPILAKALDSDKPVLRKEPEKKKEHSQIVYDMPNVQTAEYLLYKLVEAFENEGFFVHVMEIPQKLFQIRKNNTFITLEYTVEKMEFSCAVEDAAFIHTLFYEVISELENIMKNLEVLVDKQKVARNIFHTTAGADLKGSSNVINVIHPLSCEVSLRSQTKDDIIEELVNLLVRSGQLSENKRAAVFKDIMTREKNMSTGMQDGIALPHAKTDYVKKMSCAIGISKKGVKFDSIDGQPTKIFVLTIAPKKQAQSYLQFMAEISKILGNEKKKKAMLSCKSNKDMYEVISE